MRTVSGAILSSHPVSLSKAAKTLSHFAVADNGASPAITNYLKRASESFDELVRLHKELKGKGSESKKCSSRKSGGVQPTESIAYSEKNVGLDHSQMNGMGITSSVRKIRADVNGSMVSGERISKSRVVENDGFKVASIQKETMEVQSPEANIMENGSELNSGEQMKKKKRKKDAGREERSNSSVDVSNLEHGSDRHRIKSDVKQAEGKTKEIKKKMGSEIDEREGEVESDVKQVADKKEVINKEKESEADERKGSKRGDSIDYQVHEMSDGRIAPAEKKKHKEKHADQGEVADEDEATRKRKKKESKKRKSEELVDGVSDGAEHQQRIKRKKVKQDQ